MITFLLATTLLISPPAKDSNWVIGVWRSYEISAFSDKPEVSIKDFPGFESSIEFKEDMTYVKITKGETTSGNYEFTGNKIKFFELYKGEWEQTYLIRWPKNTFDPYPRTEEIDIIYPELFKNPDPNGESKFLDLDVHYKRE